jgi:thiol-disulfide isomerase/thioredoxin
MIAFALLAITLAQLPVQMSVAATTSLTSEHPEARPFKAKADARADVEAALSRAKAGDRLAIIVMGANWCHDSRALAGWFATPRFSKMIAARYELVFVDVGYRDRNLDIAKGFGFKALKGTPTVLIVDGYGKLLNKKDAPSWRNAASRSGEAIYAAFAEFTAP